MRCIQILIIGDIMIPPPELPAISITSVASSGKAGWSEWSNIEGGGGKSATVTMTSPDGTSRTLRVTVRSSDPQQLADLEKKMNSAVLKCFENLAKFFKVGEAVDKVAIKSSGEIGALIKDGKDISKKINGSQAIVNQMHISKAQDVLRGLLGVAVKTGSFITTAPGSPFPKPKVITSFPGQTPIPQAQGQKPKVITSFPGMPAQAPGLPSAASSHAPSMAPHVHSEELTPEEAYALSTTAINKGDIPLAKKYLLEAVKSRDPEIRGKAFAKLGFLESQKPNSNPLQSTLYFCKGAFYNNNNARINLGQHFQNLKPPNVEIAKALYLMVVTDKNADPHDKELAQKRLKEFESPASSGMEYNAVMDFVLEYAKSIDRDLASTEFQEPSVASQSAATPQLRQPAQAPGSPSPSAASSHAPSMAHVHSEELTLEEAYALSTTAINKGDIPLAKKYLLEAVKSRDPEIRGKAFAKLGFLESQKPNSNPLQSTLYFCKGAFYNNNNARINLGQHFQNLKPPNVEIAKALYLMVVTDKNADPHDKELAQKRLKEFESPASSGMEYNAVMDFVLEYAKSIDRDLAST